MRDDDVSIEEDVPVASSIDEIIDNSDMTPDDLAATDEAAASGMASGGKPPITLTGYQHLIVTCTRRMIAFMVNRQGGKTFAATLRIANKVARQAQNYYIFSRSERQSGNAIAQTAAHLKAVEKALKAQGKTFRLNAKASRQKVRAVKSDGSALEYSRLRISLPTPDGGVSQVIGLPASPDTVVGITGSVYADEFALHKDSREVFNRLFPVISRRREYELVLTSTPRGTNNKFYDIMTGDDYGEIFERVIVDIFTAVAQGLVLYDYNGDPITDDEGIERLRKALKDDDDWKEDYLVQFIDDVLTLLTHELIGRCESLHDPEGHAYQIFYNDLSQDFDPARDNLAKQLQGFCTGGDLYLGYDVARTKHLSAVWIDEMVENTLWQRGLVVMKNKDFELQEQVLWQFLDMPKMRKAGLDSTGLGMRTAERAVTKFGSKVVPINFGSRIQDRQGVSHPAKALLARVILERHQDGQDRYPVMDLIRDDFHSVKRKRGANPDSFTYFADESDSGHADIFTAKALSDLVAQELQEYGGQVGALRIYDPADQSTLSRDLLHAETGEEFSAIDDSLASAGREVLY